MSSAELEDHVAVVTGGTGGIGAAVAARLAASGARVVVAGRRVEEGRRVAAAIGAAATFVATDVAVVEEIDALVDGTVERFGRLDVLVNNAGIGGQTVGVAELDLQRWDHLMAVTVRAPVVAARRAAPVMRAAGGGSIVNIASVSGHRAGFSGHDYSAAKAGLIHLTRSLAVELGQHGVRVNSVSPGPVATEIFGGSADAAAPFASLLPGTQAIPRPGAVDDVAAAVAFLAAPSSAFIAGHDVIVDGGITAGRPWSVMQADWSAIADAVSTRVP